MEQILSWRKKDKIPQLKPKDVDGSFVTEASHDHLVGFHKMTIFTGQGNIRKLLGISHNSEAEMTVWSPKTCWLFPAPVIFVAIGLAIGLVDLQIMDEFCPWSVESCG